MITFKEYLIAESSGDLEAVEEMEYLIAESSGDLEAVEEMEQKMAAMDDTNRHFANQFDREVIQKRNKDDIDRSAVSTKRYNQRQARDDRRYHGKSEEEEAKVPADRDRRSSKGIEKLVKTVKNNAMPKSKRVGQMTDRRNRSYYGD